MYRLTDVQTNKQTDRTKIIYNASSRVVGNNNHHHRRRRRRRRRDNVYGAVKLTKSSRDFTWFRLQNAEQRSKSADPPTKPTVYGCEPDTPEQRNTCRYFSLCE